MVLVFREIGQTLVKDWSCVLGAGSISLFEQNFKILAGTLSNPDK